MSGTVDTLTSGDDVFASREAWKDNTIYGVGGSDSLSGFSGNDYLVGGDGNDTLNGGSNDDTLIGGAGDDSLYAGGSGSNLLVGGAGADTLVGGSNGDTLLGGAGDDSIVGGGGTNFLIGGTGADTFSGIGNSGTQYIQGGGPGDADDLILVSGSGDRVTLNTAGGTTVINGVQVSYDASLVTDSGYKLYFNNVNGEIRFSDGKTLAVTGNNDNPLDIPCFAEGTMIMTPSGERAVETLRAGDLVVTASGFGAPFKPVRWVGWRTVDLDTHPSPQQVAPVVFLPGALGNGIPGRPLAVSPDHAMLVERMLVPAGLLVDGVRVVRQPARGTVTYFHVELDSHDVMIANGAFAESYLDMGNRTAFANAGTLRMLHADFGPAPGHRAEGCFPRVTGGPGLERARLAIGGRNGAGQLETA